ncbi:hypothetical protein [Streptomyces chartreusis]|uniref:hypothetical protein n=1 Tax=Streptomyces chartreusis TaxID=1969 RepID=UPI003666F100
MFDAGHTHGPTAHFVSDCPLCDAAKDARDRAIEHLHEALYLFNGLRPEDPQPTIRLNLGPIGITGDDVHRCHSFDITAKQAEVLADALDSVNAYAGCEKLPSTAAVFARQHPDVAGQIADAFDEIFAETDPKVFLDDVLNSANPGDSARAYEDLLNGETDGDA